MQSNIFINGKEFLVQFKYVCWSFPLADSDENFEFLIKSKFFKYTVTLDLSRVLAYRTDRKDIYDWLDGAMMDHWTCGIFRNEEKYYFVSDMDATNFKLGVY
jgi:hypothetical protein